MACNWLPHNLKEVAEAIYDYMDGKTDITLPGPDFPTGGVIINKKDIPNILKTGHGSIKLRGQYKIEKQNIVFYEIPYGTKTEDLMSEIGRASDEKEIEGISEIRNESDKKGLRVVIECEKGVAPETVVRKLFAKTNLQTSISYNQVALINKTPTELNLMDCLKIYVEHNIDCIIRESMFDLKKAEARLEIVNGLLKALEDIDNIITLIKQSESAAAARIRLIETYAFTENQAKAILDMKLAKLANLEKVELNKEWNDLVNLIKKLNEVICNPEVQKAELKNRLQAIVSKFGDTRRTVLTQIDVKPEEKDIVEVTPEDCVVILSKTGDIKRIPSKSFKTQRRSGRGIKSEDEAILSVLRTNTIDILMAFTNKGKMYRLLVDNIPVGTNVSKGARIGTLITMDADERVIAATSLNRGSTAEYVVFFTKKGLIKKTSLSEYMKVKRSTGIAAINLKEGDSIANVTFLTDEDVILVTKKGMSIHFETKDITPIGRVTAGVKAIKLDEDDYVLKGFSVKDAEHIAVFSEKGFGKKVLLSELTMQGRGGKGLSIYKPSSITGDVAGAIVLKNDMKVLLVGNPNSICISAEEVPELSRTSMGNKMIKDSHISSIVTP